MPNSSQAAACSRLRAGLTVFGICFVKHFAVQHRTATIFFSFAFSSTSCFNQRIAGGCRPSHFFFQLKHVA